jgi:uncharacterized protein YjbI with pentapeptide repeats
VILFLCINCSPTSSIFSPDQSFKTLPGKDFSFLKASNSQWKSANIRRTVFYKADLENSNFQSCFAFKTDFRNSNLKGADFSNCDLRFADFRKADLRGTDFTNALLYDARLEGAMINEKTKINFNEDLKGTVFMKEEK